LEKEELMTELRLVPPKRSSVRTRNVTAREYCGWCSGNGYVVYALREERYIFRRGDRVVEKLARFEEYAPCPYCERGFGEEFPDPTKQEKASPCKAPWDGENGFWQGRSCDGIRPLIEPIRSAGGTPSDGGPKPT
jgi:hypothetical protein